MHDDEQAASAAPGTWPGEDEGVTRQQPGQQLETPAVDKEGFDAWCLCILAMFALARATV